MTTFLFVIIAIALVVEGMIIGDLLARLRTNELVSGVILTAVVALVRMGRYEVSALKEEMRDVEANKAYTKEVFGPKTN